MDDLAMVDFAHRISAHCESGSTSSLLFHYGVKASEALTFGIGSGVFFGYFPFLKMNGSPLVTYRTFPGRLMKNVAGRLGVGVKCVKFKDPEKGMEALDDMLQKGIPVCLQTAVYWLPYFPPAFRVHFDAHFVIAYGKNGSGYLISDPVMDGPVTCLREDLIKARFSKGAFSPKGKMFRFMGAPEHIDLPAAVVKGIKEACFVMLKLPIPIVGARGIRFFAERIKNWPGKHGNRKALLNLGNVVRLQEEFGTGGGGFRFMYAAFLQEAAGILKDDRLLGLSERMTMIGDRWREFAASSARICKDRASEKDNFNLLSEILLDCAEKEHGLFRDLSEIVR